MKLNVIKTYSDKYTGETVDAGKTIEVDAGRAKELLAAKVVEKPKKDAKNAK